jgi:glycosyltransferase involved in cell wall biosynthesis
VVHYIQPYSIEKNIGCAINAAIRQLNTPDTDWICLLDHDVMFLRPDSKKQLQEILETTDYDILGTATNRLAIANQLVPEMFDEYDIRKHIECANAMHEANYGKVIPLNDILAAFCLCFRVSTWQKLGGFKENSLQFDSLFCYAARSLKMKLGIMTGIYVFHAYRLLSDNPTQDITHLL